MLPVVNGLLLLQILILTSSIDQDVSTDECTKEASQTEIQATISAVFAQQNGKINSLMSISADPKLPNSFYPPNTNGHTPIDLSLIQEAQKVIQL